MEKKEIYNSITSKFLNRIVSEDNRNAVFSPFSVLVLLGMLADGTGSQTREEISRAIGCGADPKEVIDWLSYFQNILQESGALISSNAVCIREDLRNKIAAGYEEHLKEVFDGSLFSSKDMVETVNRWVDQNTGGIIPHIVDESIDPMLATLINAVAFEARWDKVYEYDDIDYGEFNNSDGSCSEVTMMSSTEWQYIEDSHFTGFIKPYKEVGYSYMALLPKGEGPDYLKKAIEKINLTSLYWSRSEEKVVTEIPEYKLEFGDRLNDFCKDLGIERAFSDNADFSPMIDEWIKVEQIIHKAFIQVDRNGTKAAADTSGVCCAGCAPNYDHKIVVLDRPFVFAVVHDRTGLPAFAGVVNHLEGGEYDIGNGEVD